jgi:omega-hydroxy-beta-dihydromenaquinone-9 sulfotransferase
MHRKVEEFRSQVEPGRFHTLRYEELVADPVAAVEAIYDHFQWPDFEAARPAIAGYARRAKRYRTNRYELSPDLCRQIAQRWTSYLDQYGYASPASDSAGLPGPEPPDREPGPPSPEPVSSPSSKSG